MNTLMVNVPLLLTISPLLRAAPSKTLPLLSLLVLPIPTPSSTPTTPHTATSGTT